MPFKRTALVLSILTARPASSFMAGKWALSWHATSSDDGHKSEGSNFIVK